MTSKRATAIEKLQAPKIQWRTSKLKMLSKEVPFLLENVLRIRFYLNSELYEDYKNYFSKKDGNWKFDLTATLKKHVFSPSKTLHVFSVHGYVLVMFLTLNGWLLHGVFYCTYRNIVVKLTLYICKIWSTFNAFVLWIKLCIVTLKLGSLTLWLVSVRGRMQKPSALIPDSVRPHP